MKYILYQRLQLSTNSQICYLGFILLLLINANCTIKEKKNKLSPISEIQIVPAPAKLLYKRGFFQLKKSSRLLMNLSDLKSKRIGEYFLRSLEKKTNYNLKIADRFTTSKIRSGIEIITEHTNLHSPESFRIEVKTDKIKIYAKDEYGLFYAVNTVISLINKTNKATWQAPQLIIEDSPKSLVRGLILEIDSLPYTQKLFAQLLQKNRINYLVTNANWASDSSKYINIIKNADLYNFGKHNILTIKAFYNSNSVLSDSSIYTINNYNQLHPDSLAILGEAMWSKPGNLSYTRLTNHLNNQ